MVSKAVKHEKRPVTEQNSGFEWLAKRRSAVIVLLMWLILAIVTGSQFFYFAFYAWLLLLLASVAIHLINIKRIFAQFEVEKTELSAGDTVNITYRVMNQSLVPAFHVSIHPVLSKAFGYDAFDADAHTLDSYEYKVIERKLICRRRGFYTLGQVRFEVTDPLGMLRSRFSKSRPIELVVRPRTDLQEALDTSPQERFGVRGMSLRPLSDQSSIKAVRPFDEGDSLRDVHWKLSAKRGTLMTKQYSQSVESLIYLYIDAQTAVYDSEGIMADHAMDLAASLLRQWLLQGKKVQLLMTDSQKTLITGKQLGSFNRFLDIFTAFAPDGWIAFEDALERFAVNHSQGGILCSISPSQSPKLMAMYRQYEGSALSWTHFQVDLEGRRRL